VPRAGLNRERVVDVATAVADDVGFDRLSLAAVADRAGVRLPSLYKHIESLDGLRRDVTVRALEDFAAALAPAVEGRTAGDALRALAAAYRGYAKQHPGRYGATVRAPRPGDAEHALAAEGVAGIVYGVLAGYTLDGEDAVDATRTLRASLHGFVALEASDGFGLPQDVDRSFDRLVDALDRALSGWTTAG
jgi:AcrR family transcriptional regulator